MQETRLHMMYFTQHTLNQRSYLSHFWRAQSFQEVHAVKLICFREHLLRSAWDVRGDRPLWVLPFPSIMINTYQTSVALPQAPPPVPPRLGRSQPVLIPAPLPSPGQSKSLLRFLVCVVVLQLFLSVVGFFYLYYNERQISQVSSTFVLVFFI